MKRIVRFGAFQVDLVAGEILKRDRRVRLQDKPFRVLEALLEYPGEMVSRDQLRARLWPADTFVDFDTGLNSAVNKVRRVLSDNAASPTYIETLGRRGYRFIAVVEADPPAAPARTEGWAPSMPAVKSLAVLPLANLSGDPFEDYFCDGMTDELIARIAGIRSLHVTSRQSIMRYKGTRSPLPAIARELRVDALLEGSVLRAGGRVRIAVRLVQASSDHHLWSGRWERELGDVLMVQSEIAAAVGQAVAATITAEEQSRLSSSVNINPEAYDLYLKGRYCWRLRSREALLRAVDYYQKAVALEPQFALAHASMAETYGPLGYLAIVPPSQSTPQMRAAAERALAIDPQQVEAQAALAACEAFHEWRWEEAEARFRHVLAANPNHTIGHIWYGKMLELHGRFEEGIAAMRRGVALDPLVLRSHTALGWQLCLGGHDAEGRDELNGVLELDPHNFFSLRDGAILDVVAGRAMDAADAFATVNELGSLAHALASAGSRAAALAALSRLEAEARDGYQSPLQFAIAYLGLGDLDGMFVRLEEAREIGVVDLPSINVDPRFHALHDDSRFRAMLSAMRL